MPTPRVSIDKQTPTAYKALVSLSTATYAAAQAAGLDRTVMEVVNLRCSQMNGCAFCLSLHHESAVKAGVTEQQIAVLPAWREAPNLYTDEMRAALELAESVTELPHHDAQQSAYERAADILDADQISVVIWGATTINAFNRVAVLSKYHVRARE